MSLPWLKDDYKRHNSQERSKSRSRSRSSSKGRHSRSSRKKSRSRSSSRGRSMSSEQSHRGYHRDRGNYNRRGLNRNGSQGKRKRSRSSSSGSESSSSNSPTRRAASNRPKYVNARIFMANFIAKEVTKDQLARHFEKYGKVVDVLVHPKNYAFIQYLKEEHARLAVEGEDGCMFNGKMINVKMAKDGQNSKGGRQGGPDRGKKDPYQHEPYGGPGGRPPFPPPGPGEYGPRDPYYPDPYRRPFPPGDPWMDDMYRRDPYADPYREPYAPPSRAPVTPPECVVFYVSRPLQNYAESIEKKVKEQSIIAISAIIPEGRTAPQMIEDLSGRGGLFAIFINQQNEVHRSLTLNIIHGTPQEHRNMPTDDAIGLIGRSFEKYVEELRAKQEAAKKSDVPTGGTVQAFLPASKNINYLLNLLADNQALTIEELNLVIEYLQERRDKLINLEKGPHALPKDPSGVSHRPESQAKDDYPASERRREYDDRGGEPYNRDARSYGDRPYYERQEEAPREERPKQAEPTDSKPTHEELTKKILSIFSGANQDVLAQQQQSAKFSSAPPVTAPVPAPPPASAQALTSTSSSVPSSTNLINFDNPNVQKALDNLIQSGPSLLKNIAPKASSAATTSLATSDVSGHHRELVGQPNPAVGIQMNPNEVGMNPNHMGMDPNQMSMIPGQMGMNPNLQGMEMYQHQDPNMVAGAPQVIGDPNHPGMVGVNPNFGAAGPGGMYNMGSLPMQGGMPPGGAGFAPNPIQTMANFMIAGLAMSQPNLMRKKKGGPAQPPLPGGAPPPPPPPPQQPY